MFSNPSRQPVNQEPAQPKPADSNQNTEFALRARTVAVNARRLSRALALLPSAPSWALEVMPNNPYSIALYPDRIAIAYADISMAQVVILPIEREAETMYNGIADVYQQPIAIALASLAPLASLLAEPLTDATNAVIGVDAFAQSRDRSMLVSVMTASGNQMLTVENALDVWTIARPFRSGQLADTTIWYWSELDSYSDRCDLIQLDIGRASIAPMVRRNRYATIAPNARWIYSINRLRAIASKPDLPAGSIAQYPDGTLVVAMVQRQTPDHEPIELIGYLAPISTELSF